MNYQYILLHSHKHLWLFSTHHSELLAHIFKIKSGDTTPKGLQGALMSFDTIPYIALEYLIQYLPLMTPVVRHSLLYKAAYIICDNFMLEYFLLHLVEFVSPNFV